MNNTTSIAGGSGLMDVNTGVWIPLIFIAFAIVALNGALCLAYATNYKLRRSSTNLLICNQAATDSLNAFLVIPMHTAARYQLDGGFSPALVTYSILVSICNLLSLATDRYLLIIRPIYHRKYVSVEKTRIAVAAIWIVPFLLSGIPATWLNVEESVKLKSYEIYNCGILTLVITCMILMVCIYMRIFTFVKKYVRGKRLGQKVSLTSDQKKRQDLAMVRKELRITRLFAALLLFFGLAYAPVVYLNLVILIRKYNLAPLEVFETSMYLFVLNSVANPVLCLMFKQDYQTAVLQMLHLRRKKLRNSCILKGTLKSTDSTCK